MICVEPIDIETGLKECFPAESIEWRIQSSGKKGDKIWAKVLAYIQNRAIQDRLDAVVGQANWGVEYKELSDGSMLCGISIMIEGRWVTKWDGASKTDIEPTKGGISSASKRAGSVWGIGRYLYELPVAWARCDANTSTYANYAKNAKGGFAFSWEIPTLPKQFLP